MMSREQNKKIYFWIQFSIYLSWFFLLIGIIIFCATSQWESILIIVFCYLLAFSFSIFMEVKILKNKRSWWHEALYIIFIWTPFFLESINKYVHMKKISQITQNLIELNNDEELNFFIILGSFWSYITRKNFRTNNIEIGIYRRDFHKGLLIRLCHLGFIFNNKFSYMNIDMQYNFQWKKKKIFLYIIDKPKSTIITYDMFTDAVSIYPEYSLKLAKYKYNNLEFFGPKIPNKYLRTYFGKQWREHNLIKDLYFGPNSNVGERNVWMRNFKLTKSK